MLLQMPLFFGLIFIMNQAFLYITTLRNLYYNLSAQIIAVPGLIGQRIAGQDFQPELLDNLSTPLIPNSMLENGFEVGRLMSTYGYGFYEAIERAGEIIAIGYPPHLSRVLNRFTSYEWNQLFDYISANFPAQLPGIMDSYVQLTQIETFFGLSVVEQGGWGWPGILIPILVAITMFASSWLTQLRTLDPDADEKAKMQQRMMLIVMPLMMAAFTVTFPVAVGIYWIASQVFGVVQDLIMNKRAGIPFRWPFVKYDA